MSYDYDATLAAAIQASLQSATKRTNSQLITFPKLLGLTRSGKDLLTLEKRAGDVVFDEREPEITPNGPREILIKMTVGSFQNYSNSCLLHCGVSDSKSRVWNFDQNGYHIDTRWKESIRVRLESKLSDYEWDNALKTYTDMHKLVGRPYQNLGYNCYDFAVGFLNFITFRGSNKHTIQAAERDILGPRAKISVAYVKLWKRINSTSSKSIPYPFKRPSAGGSRPAPAPRPSPAPASDAKAAVPSNPPALGRQFSGSPPVGDGKVKIVLYKDGFVVNAGTFRPFGVPKNDEFKKSLLSGSVPLELASLANGGRLDVDLDDLRSKEYRPAAAAAAEQWRGRTVQRGGHRSMSTRETLAFSTDGKTVTYERRRKTRPFDATKDCAPVRCRFKFEGRPYKRLDGNTVQRHYFVLYDDQNTEIRVIDMDAFKRFKPI